MRKLFIIPALTLGIMLSAQEKKAPDNWYNLYYKTDKVKGVGTEKTYKELVGNRTPDTVIVAVIDGGVDYMHEDLKDVMWKNPKEIPGNGIDDDKNGYVDDIYGWNFIGGKDGKNVHYDNLELVRLLRPLDKKFKGKDSTQITAAEKDEFKRYLKLKAEYDKDVKRFTGLRSQMTFFNSYFRDIAKSVNKDSATFEDFKNYQAGEKYKKIHMALKLTIKTEADYKDLREQINEGAMQVNTRLDYHLNLDYDPRSIVGDDYDNPNDRFYGNNDVKGPDASHGTHVAGIIAANRFNNVGVLGVANAVKIMAIRCVPDGDERDKDVANAIRYAVDNGAKIINMSFGKSYGYNKKLVDEAVKYAESKGVLLVHAAGNDSKDNDKTDNFPNPRYLDGGVASNWIEIGALSWMTGKKSPARFTNYGQNNVDVFAPGVDIMNCKVDGGYVALSGTSMASPVAAGVATVLKSYFPSLTPQQIKSIIEETSDKSLAKKKVIIPGEKKKKIKFKKLSRTGGTVDLYAAFQKAAAMTGK
ncbi:MAG: S8 family peptidase [Bacteroidia bacterium]